MTLKLVVKVLSNEKLYVLLSSSISVLIMTLFASLLSSVASFFLSWLFDCLLSICYLTYKQPGWFICVVEWWVQIQLLAGFCGLTGNFQFSCLIWIWWTREHANKVSEKRRCVVTDHFPQISVLTSLSRQGKTISFLHSLVAYVPTSPANRLVFEIEGSQIKPRCDIVTTQSSNPSKDAWWKCLEDRPPSTICRPGLCNAVVASSNYIIYHHRFLMA